MPDDRRDAPGDGLLIRYVAGPPGFDAWTWVAGFQVTITADAWTIDVATAPRIGPALPPGDVVVGETVAVDLELGAVVLPGPTSTNPVTRELAATFEPAEPLTRTDARTVPVSAPSLR